MLSNDLMSSSARFFQAQATAIAVIWGGGILFLTATNASTADNIATSWIAGLIGIFYALYWANLAARFRVDEAGKTLRLRALERRLKLGPGSAPVRLDIPPIVRLFAVTFPFPVSMLIGPLGAVLWLWIIARSMLLHFGWL